MDKLVESFVRQCPQCAGYQNNPQPIRMHPWEHPRYAWQRIHVDYAGPFLNHNFLIVVDAFSKWPEIILMKSTTSQATIHAIMQIFSTHGLPERIVTDNGPQFCSAEFAQFFKVNGIQHTKTAPYHPASNGEAERFVQTLKHNMKCRNANSANVFLHIQKFLLAYRTTNHAVTGLTPSNLLMGRRIRSKLDLLVPDYQAHQNQKKWNQLVPQKTPHYKVNSPVMVRSYGTTEKWVPGRIQNELGNLHYKVDVDGKVSTRNVDQLLPSPVKESKNDKRSSNNDDTQLESVGQSSDIHDSDTADSGGVKILPERKTRGVPPERLDL